MFASYNTLTAPFHYLALLIHGNASEIPTPAYLLGSISGYME
jgi:hypothetical protein